MLPVMTLDARTAAALDAYADDPVPEGTAVLLLDGSVCMQVAGLADSSDAVLRGNTAEVLRQTAQEVVLAVARPGADLTVADHRLWRDLHDDLDGEVVLMPIQALPAARA